MYSEDNMVKAEALTYELFENLVNIFDNGGLSAQINTAHISKHPYLSMTQGLAYLLAKVKSGDKYIKIMQFVTNFVYLESFSVDDFLSFDTNVVELPNNKNGFNVRINFEKENGFLEFEYLCTAFKELLDYLN